MNAWDFFRGERKLKEEGQRVGSATRGKEGEIFENKI